MRVLLVAGLYPPPTDPARVPFLVRRVRFLREAGIDLDVFHFRGGVTRPDNYLRGWLRLRRALRETAYDLLDVQFGQSGLITLWPHSLPMVVTFRGTDLHGGAAPGEPAGMRTRLFATLIRTISRRVAARADRVVLVADHLRAYLPPGVQADILPSGLDLDFFKPVPSARTRL
ncbi:MAG: glycosyltransferase, partial [Anaerolineae bacterium]